MKELINILKKIEKVLFLIETLLKKEHLFLLKINNNVHILDSIIKRKEKLFKKFLILNQEKILFEKNNSVFMTLNINLKKLNDYNKNIHEKCILLRDLNRKNKIIMNQNFYLNQHFLELCIAHKIAISDNYHNDLKI
ncbi:flagella synthesis protein FlgN [Buchnera aphidicola]|uniref:Flagella synthesis protein FlgN n=1 Tax=Buchnera aphidicola str. Ua (Uroleucon ambrosiae) TaxID=1005057 RepID=G2LPI9_BUCUM|nr:flagella synthesis protein FlgN [Buchnera aphidicola]AEO08126.1 flagella synthesis protein FlgN [Buchnera aphidicola str. Ua (Uroleucon ambrosiae)]